MLSWHAVTPGHLANLITPMNVGTTHNKMKRWILDIADVRMVTGDVDIVEYSIGRGMAPVHSGSTGTQPSNIKIIYLSRTSLTLLLVRAVTWRWRVAVRWEMGICCHYVTTIREPAEKIIRTTLLRPSF